MTPRRPGVGVNTGAGSIVALMHPDGAILRQTALGADAEARIGLAPVHGGALIDLGPVDLLWLVPTASECGDGRWLEATMQWARTHLAPDGIVYLLPPRVWRGGLVAAARTAGFEVDGPIAHLHPGGRERLIFPLTSEGSRFALASALHVRGSIRRAGEWLMRISGWFGVGVEHWPTVGFVARDRGGRPPWDWVERLAGGALRPAAVVALNGWRGPGDSTVLHLLDDRGAHAGVVKLARAIGPSREAERLTSLGAAASEAGAYVPRVLGAGAVGGRAAVALTVVAGQRAYEKLTTRSVSPASLIDMVDGWLERWNDATASRAPLGAPEVEAELFDPLAALASHLADAEAYAARLRALVALLGAEAVPRVAVHGDLTSHNLLLDDARDHRLGVVDWEGARADGWPLLDLEYVAVDAVLAGGAHRERVSAWRACFDSGGSITTSLAARRARHIASLQLPAAFAELCHHACWLHHAANEHRKAESGARPFLEIVRALAAAERSSG